MEHYFQTSIPILNKRAKWEAMRELTLTGTFQRAKKKPERVLASHGKTIKFMLVNSGIAKK